MMFGKDGKPLAYQHKAVTPTMLQHMPLKSDLRDVFGIGKPTKMGRPRLKLPKRTGCVYL